MSLSGTNWSYKYDIVFEQNIGGKRFMRGKVAL